MSKPKRSVIVELKHNKDLAEMAFGAATALEVSAAPKVSGCEYDSTFPPTAVPGRRALGQAVSVFAAAAFDLVVEPEESTYVVRALVDENKLDDLAAARNVVGVFSDPVIEPQAVCPGSPAVGTDADVERLLCAPALRAAGMDGTGVLVAIVDSGINLAHLSAKGKTPAFDAARSWVPQPGLTPGSLPVGHGTMCAFDVCIAAPKCTLLDVALLLSGASGPTPMSGVLSDALRAYRHLIDVMLAPRRPGDSRSLVVNNSWGMFHPSWDFPVGHPGNYSDNPNHPFNRIVGDLERAGADILFAAGNCGAACPDDRCRGLTSAGIFGANSHPAVLSVAGVDTTKVRAGYSTAGPGRLTQNKPDISGYTHFRGSGVYAADGGTSAATPVVAGVVAAVRSKRPYDAANPVTHPAAIRSLLTSTAEDLGTAGYDLEHGFGVVNGCELKRRLAPVRIPDPVRPINLCDRYPWLCGPGGLCLRFPWLCRGIPVPPRPPLAPAFADAEAQPDGAPTDPIEAAFQMGYIAGMGATQTAPPAAPAAKCGCGN
jgi:subtilisin family serine protease